MIISRVVFAVVVAVALPVWSQDLLPIRPSDASTPGAIGSTDVDDVCGRGPDGRTYSQRHRQTTAEMKRDAYETYGVQRNGRDFEVDHRVPLCIGGADDQRNLWPQEGFERPNYHDKDRLEERVCEMVCRDHSLNLQEGQAIFTGDWIAGYQRIFGQSPE